MQRLILFILAISMALPAIAFAEASAQFQVPGFRAPDDPNVNGFRFSLIYGHNDSVKGFDLGFANFSEQKDFSGFSFIFGISKTTGSSSGCACSLINIHEGNDTGLNGAFVNLVNNIESGVNVGFVNITNNYSALDVGGLSMAKKAKIQVGFVNFADNIESLQIGFLNFAENGFFPVFPFFNFPKK